MQEMQSFQFDLLLLLGRNLQIATIGPTGDTGGIIVSMLAVKIAERSKSAKPRISPPF
jgi:hypothetical protein